MPICIPCLRVTLEGAVLARRLHLDYHDAMASRMECPTCGTEMMSHQHCWICPQCDPERPCPMEN